MTPPRCSAVMTRCKGEDPQPVRLADGTVRSMCVECRAVAERLGMLR